jgi:hypothetical protein
MRNGKIVVQSLLRYYALDFSPDAQQKFEYVAD